MVINTNIAATAASRTLGESAKALSASLTRLSSGSKIVSPEDDAAGLAQSIKFDSQISRNEAVNSNITNAISFSQTQDGFLQKVQSALDRMSEISVLAQDVTKTDNDRESYNAEFQQLINFINDIATKKFNGVELFQNKYEVIETDEASWTEAKADAVSRGGNLAAITSGREMSDVLGILGDDFFNTLWFGGSDADTEGTWEWVTGEDWDYANWRPGSPNNHGGIGEHSLLHRGPLMFDEDWYEDYRKSGSVTEIGTWDDHHDESNGYDYILESPISSLEVTIDDKGKTISLGPLTPINASGSVSTVDDSKKAFLQTRELINVLGYKRADIGSIISRLKNTADSVVSMNGNLSAANSRIKDVDVAEESTRFARSSILVQSGTAMLSQANILPEMALKLLG